MHGGAVAADALTVLETGLSDRDRGQRRARRTGIAGRRPRPAARRRTAASLLDAGTTTARLAGALPADRRLDRRSPTPSRSPPGWPASPPSSCTCCRAGSARTTQAAVGERHRRRPRPLRADVAFLGTNGISARATASPRPTTTRPPSSAPIVAARAAGRACSPTPARSASSAPVRFAELDRGRRARHRRRASPEQTATPSRRPASRWWSHDRHAHRQPQHRPHRRARRARSQRGGVQRVDAVARPGRRQGRQHLPGRRRRRRCPPSRCSPPTTTTRSSTSCCSAGIDCRPVAPDRRGPGQPHPHRARRHHHQDQQPRRHGRRRAPRRPARAPSLHRARRPPTGSCWPGPCRPAPPTTGTPTWSPRCTPPARRSPSTPASARCARWSTALPGAVARPDEAQRRGARLAHRRRPRRPRGRPARPPRPPRTPRRRGASARCSPRWAATAPCSSPPTGAWHATPPPITVVSTVGAGDSSLFGYLLGDLRGRPRPSGSRWPSPTAAPPPAFPAPPIPEPAPGPPRRSSSVDVRSTAPSKRHDEP